MALDLSFKPFSGVGIVSFHKRNASTGNPSEAGYDLGETVKLDLTQNAPRLEMATSRSADRGTAFSMAQAKTGEVAISMKTVSDFVWGLLSSGTWTEVAAGSAVAGWVAPAGVLVGQIIKLPAMNVSAVAVKDSTGSPLTLVANTDYELDAVAGTVKIKNLGSYVQPLKVDYTPGAVKILGGLKAPNDDWIVVFNGTNSYDNSRVTLEIFKFRFDPEGTLAMISDGSQYPEFQLKGSIQKDETKASGSSGGQYYRLVTPNA